MNDTNIKLCFHAGDDLVIIERNYYEELKRYEAQVFLSDINTDTERTHMNTE